MSYFKELDDELKCYLEPAQIKKCYQAYSLAEQAHRGQMRRSGEPYITHPVAAALILARMRLDYQTIMATLLHDVVEDTSISKEDLLKRFGEEVTALVDGVTKLTKIKFESKAEAQAENFRKMVLAMVKDIRVIIVKLADRLHNMRTLGAMPHVKRRRIAVETLEIYAPIANRYGRLFALRSGLILNLIGILLCLLAVPLHIFWVLVLARGITALGAASGLCCTFMLLNESLSPERAKHALSFKNGILGFGIYSH